jgi:hypothetical protein
MLLGGQEATAQTLSIEGTKIDAAINISLTVAGTLLASSTAFLGFAVTALKESTQTQVTALKESTASQVTAIEKRVEAVETKADIQFEALTKKIDALTKNAAALPKKIDALSALSIKNAGFGEPTVGCCQKSSVAWGRALCVRLAETRFGTTGVVLKGEGVVQLALSTPLSQCR